RGLQGLYAPVIFVLGSCKQAPLLETIHDPRNVRRVAAERVRQAPHGSGLAQPQHNLGLHGRQVMRLGDALEVRLQPPHVPEEQLDDLGACRGRGVGGPWNPAFTHRGIVYTESLTCSTIEDMVVLARAPREWPESGPYSLPTRESRGKNMRKMPVIAGTLLI